MAKKTTKKKAPKRSSTTKTSAKKTAKKAPAKKTTAKKTTVKKTTVKKTTAKKKATKKTTKKATTAKKAPAKKSTKKSTKSVDEIEVKVDRRAAAKEDRRTEEDRRQVVAEVDTERREAPERRTKVARRRQIDPTTCERDYSNDEIEFMHALDEYKRRAGRMFPTCSEILEVVRDLGYRRLTPEEVALLAPLNPAPETVESEATENGEQPTGDEDLVESVPLFAAQDDDFAAPVAPVAAPAITDLASTPPLHDFEA